MTPNTTGEKVELWKKGYRMTPTDYMEARANHKWNTSHPADWKRPPKKMPHWFNLRGYGALRNLEEVFGIITQDDLDRFWSEYAKGQSVYEDYGGFLIRCYDALMGRETVEPYTYSQAVSDLMEGMR